jgi:DNA polymerase elongation subunit (family B)
LGYAFGLFNDFSEAERVTTTGQELLKEMIKKIIDAGGTPVEVDTDGVFFIPPEHTTEFQEKELVQKISEEMPEGINIGFDGRYKAMLSYKKKNYCLIYYDGKVKVKGSAFRSRGIEPFCRIFIKEAIKKILQKNIQGLHELFLKTHEDIKNRCIPIEKGAIRPIKNSVNSSNLCHLMFFSVF